MSTETTKKKIKIDNGTEFARVYTDKEVDSKLTNKQDTLVSGTNIKTFNGQSILGSGDLSISGEGESGISVIELTDKNGTISSAQLGEINANPQNFAFKYNGKILLFTRADSTTYQYCNNTTNSSENNVVTKSTLLTIELSTGAYTIAENVHNVVANSIHPANGGDLTNIQVGSKVYSIPSGGGGSGSKYYAHYINIETTSSKPTASFTIYLITKDSNKYTTYNDFERYLTKNGEINVAGYITDADNNKYDISRLEINFTTKQLVTIYYIYQSTFHAVDASVTTIAKQRINTVKLDAIYSISDTVIEL